MIEMTGISDWLDMKGGQHERDAIRDNDQDSGLEN